MVKPAWNTCTTVPEGTSRVRLSFHADLSDDDHARLLAAIAEVATSLRARA